MLQTQHAPVMPYSSFASDDTRWMLLQQTYACPNHGSDANLCHDVWSAPCSSAKYGFACPACGRTDNTVPDVSDMAHGELCCGTMTCSSEWCMTHETNF